MRRATLFFFLASLWGSARAAEWIPERTLDVLASQPRELARFQAEAAPRFTLDQLSDRADAAFEEARLWEMRRLMFKMVELDPTDVSTVGTLALIISMFRSDADAAQGKDTVRYDVSDFADLGGLKNKALFRIAADPNPDRFDKSRALFDWARRFNRKDPDFYIEFARYIGSKAGEYHRTHKEIDRSIEEEMAAVEAYQTAFRLARGQSRRAGKIAPLYLLSQADLCLTLIRLAPKQSSSYRALAIDDYLSILADPEANDGFKGSARRQLDELKYALLR